MSDTYEQIVEMLTERGINRIPELLQPFQTEEHLDAVLGAIKWYDDLPKTGERAVGPGLLVNRIQDGGVAGYKRPTERQTPAGSLRLTPEMAVSLRSALYTPHGITREEARFTAAYRASKLNMGADALLDEVMGSWWRETPPHPAIGGHADYDFPPTRVEPERYSFYVHRGQAYPDSPSRRRQGESDWNYACRFWGWTDPPELRKLDQLRKIKDAEARRAAAAQVSTGGGEVVAPASEVSAPATTSGGEAPERAVEPQDGEMSAQTGAERSPAAEPTDDAEVTGSGEGRDAAAANEDDWDDPPF